MAAGALALGLLASLSTTGGATPAVASSHQPQLGIDTYFTYNCQSQSLIDQWATTEVDAFKALGANAIGIGFPLYTSSITSNDVFTELQCGPGSTYESPPPAVLSSVIQIAHAAGLKVLIRPLLDQENLYEQNPKWWRGKLQPTDPEAWITNYLKTLQPYLAVAQTDHVESFAVETELDSLADEPFWPAALALIHKLYSGSLAFNYSWQDVYGKKVRHPGTSMSIDAYPKTAAPLNATVAQLVAQWSYLLKRNPTYQIPVPSAATIDEVGISAQDGMYQQPESTGLPFSEYPFNQAVQANWFEAACAFAQEYHLQGIYYWGPWLTSLSGALPQQPYLKNTSQIQPLAQAAIKRCFSSLAWHTSG